MAVYDMGLQTSRCGLAPLGGQTDRQTLQRGQTDRQAPQRGQTDRQLVYAFSLLDLVLVRQINVRLGILNEVFVLRFSRLAETIAQFKILPFTVLFANICPRGSLTSFLASALSLSSIASGFLGVGLASLIGITAGDYSSLVLGIMAQFLAVLLPLGWLHNLPMSEGVVGKERKRGFYRRS
ncbi:hypothetical protein ACFX13_022799 [Malus domestica]